MREGLMLTGLMAAVVATAAAINVASPNLLKTHGTDNPGVIQFQRPAAPITTTSITPPVTGMPIITPVPISSPPTTSWARVPPLTMPTQPPANPDLSSQPATEGETPTPSKPCAVGLVLNPLLGVCVVT